MVKAPHRSLRVSSFQEGQGLMNDASTPTAPENIGQRVRLKRSRAGLTQQGLADLAFVSRSLIQQVETGKKPATPSLVAALASALSLDPAELYGQPYRGATAHKDRAHAAIPEIRRALACADVPPDLDAPPRPLDVLSREVDELQQLVQAAKYAQVGVRLPAALAELTAHAHESGSPRAWRLLNRAQSAAVTLARCLGYGDLAHFGLQEAAASASRSDDPNLYRRVLWVRALLLLGMGAWDAGLKVVVGASKGIDLDHVPSQMMFGSLQLRAAVLCARAGMATDAWEHHGQAEETVRRLPARTPVAYDLQFGAGNVAIHGVAVAVELEDFDEAIRRDQGLVPPQSLAAERRAHHEIDMSRALLSVGKHDAALRRLARADRVASQMTRYHPMAREGVSKLGDHYRTLPEPLRVIQDHMGLA